MTPQLQQAIKLLQLSTLDLQLEIQEAIESNPLLELIEEDSDDEQSEADNSGNEALNDVGSLELSAERTHDSTIDLEANSSSLYEAEGSDSAEGSSSSLAEGSDSDEGSSSLLAEGSADGSSSLLTDGADLAVDEQWQKENIPEDLPVDTSWDDIYTNAPTGIASSGSEAFATDYQSVASETLQEHLLWQLNLTTMSDTDNLIAISLIDGIQPDGMLSVTLEEILSGFDPEMEVELDEVQAVLTRIQHFDPIGVGARDLSECLLLQLRQLPEQTLHLSEAITITAEYLDLLASRDFNTLKRKTRWNETTLQHAIELIQSMNPRPGSSIAADETEYIIPDVIVHKDKGRWVVELNPDATPKLGINATYAGMIKRADKGADNTFLKDNLQEARWFLKSLQSRNETLLKVSTRIVEHQKGFLEYGEEAMQPLVLHDVAEAVDMHESTISRVTNRKYMHTPRGIFELKYFFSSHVGTNTGGEVSSTAIRALIKKLTAAENPRKPLSDSKIAAILGEQNIRVARRTVAKYRESLSIPPSNERKRLVGSLTP